MTKTWPALDITWISSVAPDPQLPDHLALVLDDLSPIALEDSDDGRHWRVYFDSDVDRDSAADVIRAALGAQLTLSSTNVEDEGWALKVQQELRAVRVGRIVVAPPWDVPSSAASEEIVILVEPSMGFGTGHHQSTRLCLRALQELPLDGVTVLDIGTGSGVLALACARLGAAHVIAIEHDEDSATAARANVERNTMASRVEVRLSDAGRDALPQSTVVVANLTATLLRRYAEAITSAVAAGGRLTVSGFTADQVPLVTHAFCTLSERARYDEDDWVALVFASGPRQSGLNSAR
jgi:ribosomal protein L11 methyltransferase